MQKSWMISVDRSDLFSLILRKTIFYILKNIIKPNYKKFFFSIEEIENTFWIIWKDKINTNFVELDEKEFNDKRSVRSNWVSSLNKLGSSLRLRISSKMTFLSEMNKLS